MFKDNGDVVFADSALSGGGPRGGATASPGAGGWPTIRYYNKETGVDGANYEKKSDMSMCDELGPKGMSEGNNGCVIVEAGEVGGTRLHTHKHTTRSVYPSPMMPHYTLGVSLSHAPP